jgi:drug/metabolite transporter (DMT)-like permease
VSAFGGIVRARAGGVALVALGAAIWGLDGAIRAPLVDRWSSWTIVLFEHVVLVAVVAPYLLVRRHAVRALSARGWLSVVVIAWGGSALATLAFTAAFQYGNPTVVVLLQKTQPLWGVAAALAVLGESPRRRLRVVALPALLGAYLLSFGWTPPDEALTGADAKAALLALTAAALWGSATAFGRRALQELPPNVLTGLRFTVALPLLVAIAAAHGALLPPGGGSGGSWSRILLLALLPGLLALVLYYRGLRSVPASVATFAELAFPATSVVVGYVLLDATVSAAQLIGFAIVWASIAALHSSSVRVRPRLRTAEAAAR